MPLPSRPGAGYGSAVQVPGRVEADTWGVNGAREHGRSAGIRSRLAGGDGEGNVSQTFLHGAGDAEPGVAPISASRAAVSSGLWNWNDCFEPSAIR